MPSPSTRTPSAVAGRRERRAPDGRIARLTERVRELETRLSRERSRNAGLERGVTALEERSRALRAENAELRRILGRDVAA